MNYVDWLETVPVEIREDALWNQEVYRLALFAAGLGWHDTTKLFRDGRTAKLAAQHFDAWLKGHGLTGLAGIDTRRLTQRIRDEGAPNGAIAFPATGAPDTAALHDAARAWPGLEGMDLAKEVSCRQTYSWDETVWTQGSGYGHQQAPRFFVTLRCEARGGEARGGFGRAKSCHFIDAVSVTSASSSMSPGSTVVTASPEEPFSP